MGVRNQKKAELERLALKTLDARFLHEIQTGLNCSPFEAEAVLEVVREVYLQTPVSEDLPPPPGTMSLIVIDADEPSGKSIAECTKQRVRLTIHRGADDDRLLQAKGADEFRRARIPELCQEALSQGGLLTREDLAYRVFFVTPRTISRDLKALRENDPERVIPLRSTRHDIGPVLTHRVEIVRLALEGKTMTQICRIMHHSPAAVANYLSTFVRCAQLVDKGMQGGQISFLLRRGKGLVEQYLELLDQCRHDRNYDYHLGEMLALAGAKKGAPKRRRP